MTRRDSAGNERPTGGEAVQFHDDIASEWDEKYLCGGFARRARWFSDRVLPSLKGEGRWLDVGCGTGYFTRLMSAQGLSVIGVDASPAMVERAELIALASPGTNRIDFQRVETAERLPFADNSMAGCVCLSVIEYLDRPEACFDELARVTKPGGLLVISVPNRYSPLRAVQRLAALMLGKATSLPLKYRALSKFDMSREELRAALEQRGFDQIQILGFDRVLPTPVLSIVPPGLMYAIAVKGAVTPREGSVSPQVAASPS